MSDDNEDEIVVKIVTDTETFNAALDKAMQEAARSVDTVTKAKASLTKGDKESADAVAQLEKAVLKGASAYQKTAIELEKVYQLEVKDTAQLELRDAAIKKLSATLDTQLDRSLQNAGRSASGLKDELEAAIKSLSAGGVSFGSFGKLATAMFNPVTAATAAVVGLGGGIIALGDKAARADVALAKQAANANVGVEAFSRYQLVAQKAGLTTEEFSGTLIHLEETSIKAQEGAKKSVRAFDEIGISVADLKGKKPDELFDLVADRIAHIEDPALRSTEAMRLLGNEGLGRVAGKVQELKKAAQDLGIVLDDQAANEAKAYTIAMKSIETEYDALITKAGRALVPALASVAEAFGRVIGIEGSAAKANSDEISFLSASIAALNERKREGIKIDEDELAGYIARKKIVEGLIVDEKKLESPGPSPAHVETKAGKTDTSADDAADKELQRVKALQAAIQSLQATTLQAESQDQSAIEKANIALDQKILRINEERSKALDLAKTSAERATIEQRTDAAIVAEENEHDRAIEKAIDEVTKARDTARSKELSAEKESTKQYLDQIKKEQNASAEAAYKEYEFNIALKKKEVAEKLRLEKEVLSATTSILEAGASIAESISSASLADEKEKALEKYRIQQAVGVATAVVHAAEAAAAVFAAEPGELVTKEIALGVALATGAAQVIAVATAPPPSFGAGGVVNGPLHPQGGVGINVEGGEVVGSRADAARWGGAHKLDEVIRNGPDDTVGRAGNGIAMKQHEAQLETNRLLRQLVGVMGKSGGSANVMVSGSGRAI